MSTIKAEKLPTKGPKYLSVADTIAESIRSGDLAADSKLPPVRDLAYQLGITPGTVARAYTVLTNKGLLRAEVGRGTFVARNDQREMTDDGVPFGQNSPVSPIEIDVVPHGNHGTIAESWPVSLFSPGLPNLGQAGIIRKLLAEVAQDPPSGLMHYPSHASSERARIAVLNWLDNVRLGRVVENDIVLANGGQNAILIILQSILRGPRPSVLVEELSYPGFRRAADLLRAPVVPVAMDKDGLIPEALEEAARTHGAQVICTSPDVQNPTGIFTPIKRREAIVDVARRLDLQIVEDACYQSSGIPVPSYRMLAPERGWYLSSLSKTITPGLRVGYAVAPEAQSANLRRAADHSFFGLSAPLVDLTAKLLVHPETIALEGKVRKVFDQYIRSAVNHLGIYELTWRESVPFLWLGLPKGWRAAAFCQAAEAHGVQIRSAEEFVAREARAPHAVRIAVNAMIPLDIFDEAMLRLRRLLDNPPERISV